MKHTTILVLGAGVSGLTTALRLKQSGHDVTIWAKESPGNFGATSLNAYAVWTPVRLNDDPRVEAWAFETLSHFVEISARPRSGVRLLQVTDLQSSYEEPWYASRCTNKAPNFRHARPDEIPAEYIDAHILERAPIIDPTIYLPWLMTEFLEAGGRYFQQEIKQWSDCPQEFDVIVNCTALGARTLCQDLELHSLPMQYVTLNARGFAGCRRVVFDQTGANAQAHFVPHDGYVKLGASFGPLGSDSLSTDDESTAAILQRCSLIMPECGIISSDIISVTTCLRPRRSSIRVELEILKDGRTVVHNYGHDGKAFIVSYGVAAEICRQVEALA